MELREAYLLMKLMKPEGGGATVEELNVTANGTYTPDEGVDGFAPVNVSVPASAVDSGTININSNGTHDVTGYASAEVSVSGGGAGAFKTGTIVLTEDIGASFKPIVSVTDIGFTPSVFILCADSFDTTVDATFILYAIHFPTMQDNKYYGNDAYAWRVSSAGRLSVGGYGSPWTSNTTYSKSRLYLNTGDNIIYAKADSSYKMKAGTWHYFAAH